MRWCVASVLWIAACHGVTGDDAGAGGGPGDGGRGPGGGGPYFREPMFFNRDVTTAPVAPDSAAQIAALRAAGGWGAGDRLLIDFDLTVLRADPTTPRRAFMPTVEFYDPDCDRAEVPVPVGGNLEGEHGYECRHDGDCHLLVYDEASAKLYEMWRANMVDRAFWGGCLAVWDTRASYGEALRGDQCTSADAAGFPIAPLLFTADEVAAGEIAHAIRFVLPNDRIRHALVRPATHATATTGPPDAPPYGVHLRLRSDYPVASLPGPGARVVARALQRYGMYHADGGEFALTAQSDRHTARRWSGLLGPTDLAELRVEDFEVIDHGDAIDLTFRCDR